MEMVKGGGITRGEAIIGLWCVVGLVCVLYLTFFGGN